MANPLHIFILASLTGINYISGFEISKSGCPGSKGCVSVPDDCTTSADCQYLVTYTPGKDSVYFEMSADKDWAAIGFNKDAQMVGANAVICSKPSSGATPVIGYYPLTAYTRPSISPTPSGLFNMSGEYSNGVIKCRFTRNKLPGMMKYDLNDKIYLIYAKGNVGSGGTLQEHSWKVTSSNKVDLSSTAELDTKGRALLLAHGALMIIAWVGFAAVGMFTARSMKTFWGEKMMMEVKVWFMVHRTCMTVVVLATILSFILVFVHVGGWSQIGAHAYIGVTVVVLTVIQPIVAFFRPHPGAKNRVIFYWFHVCNANIVFILAITNCFIGVMKTTETIGTGYIVLIVFVVMECLLSVGYEIYIGMNPPPEPTPPAEGAMQIEDQGGSRLDTVRKVVYVLLIIASFTCCLAMIVLLGTGSSG